MKREFKRSSLPPPIKRAIKQSVILSRMPTSQIRLMPDFILIGGQRCGTTSLYNHLANHPCIAPALWKEVHFFDTHFQKGTNWYRAHFPTLLKRRFAQQVLGRPLIVGESSPYYIFHPHAPKRVSTVVPEAKLVALLRDPVNRAFSHYQHEVMLGVENLSFEEALEREEERLRGETEAMLSDSHYYGFNHQHFSYKARGIYVDQLEAWLRLFPREQILVLRSENFFASPSEVFGQIVQFLDLPDWEPEEYLRYGRTAKPKMDVIMRGHLRAFFAPHNQRLYDLLGIDFGWG